MTERTGIAVWNGPLIGGNGNVSTGTGVIADQPVTWAARTEEPEGMTSPEDLIAAAHASCYAMAFAFALQNNGTPADQLDVVAKVGFGPKEGGGMMVTHSHLSVTGSVPGLDAETFARIAAEGEAGCPVSNALRNNVEITLEAQLAKA